MVTPIADWLCLASAALSCALFTWNLLLFRRAPRTDRRGIQAVSVLIPARNEEKTIGNAVESILANRDVRLEVIVLDDGSDDATAAIVQRIAVQEPRVRVVPAPPLPSGWCGKQHACSILAEIASHDLLCFLDADVRLSADALRRMTDLLEHTRADLISGFPRQETVTFLERLLLPQIHFVLLGYLPLAFMRRSTAPGFAAGCGQLILARRHAYVHSGGHAAIRASLHDGILLPRIFRKAGLRTDLFDATDLATCRMYRSAGEVWRGLAKNATEGMAAPSRIPVFTALLFCGHVLPFLLLALRPQSGILALAAAMAWWPRMLAVLRFRQPVDSAVLHPLGVLVLLAVQWYSLVRHLLRRPASWKGRAYAAGATSSIPTDRSPEPTHSGTRS